MIKRLVLMVLVTISFCCYGIQFEILQSSSKNIAIGGSGISIFKDPSFTFVNPANVVLDKNSISLYYEAVSSVVLGNIFDLYNKRLIFDPVNFGISFKIDDYTRVSFAFSPYVYDIDVPQISYKVLLLGISKRLLPSVSVGGSLGPVIGVSDELWSFSFIAIGGVTFSFDDIFSFSFVFKSPFSVKVINPYYGNIIQTFPPVISTGGSYFALDSLVFSVSFDIVLLNNLSARFGSRELFVSRYDFIDYLLPKFGIIYYDRISGYRMMLGFYKSQIESLSFSIPQYHLTFGVTFFIRIPSFEDFELNLSVDDCSLMNFLSVAPLNFRRISINLSSELRF
ncbi:MAG: hypothetical protein ACK4F9_03255 [Brevinematia bacterium]